MRIVLISFILLICLNTGRISASEIPDSLLTFGKLRETCINAPQEALKQLEQAQYAGHLNDFDINTLYMFAYDALKMDRMALKYAEQALRSETVRKSPKEGLPIYFQAAIYLASLNMNEKAVDYSIKGYELAKKHGNIEVQSGMLSVTADVKRSMGLQEESYQLYRKAIALLQNSNEPKSLANLSFYYGTLMTNYADDNRLEDAIATGLARKEIIDRMSKMEGPPAAYIDRQYGYLYSKQAYIYQLAGDKEKARSAFQSFLQTDFAATPEGKTEGNPYLLKTGNYQTVLANNAYLEQLISPDTLNNQFLIILNENRNAYEGLRRYAEAFHVQKRISIISDSIYIRDKQEDALEIATIYETQQKDLLLKEQTSKLKERNIISASLGAFATLLILFLLWVYFNAKDIRIKNHALVAHVDKLLKYQHTLEIEKKRNQAFLHQYEANDKQTANRNEENKSDNAELFERLNMLIIEKKLYLKTSLSRDELTQLIGVDKTHFAEIIYENTGGRLNEYLNGLRVEHAVKLMRQYDNYTLRAIAEESGFNNMSTFHNAFKKKIGMTPSQYWSSITPISRKDQ